MKCRRRITFLSTLLSAGLGVAAARPAAAQYPQTFGQSRSLPPAAAEGPSQPSAAPDFSSPAIPSPGNAPQAPDALTTPPPEKPTPPPKEVVSWSTKALREALAASIPDKAALIKPRKKPSKKSALSDEKVAELRSSIARNEKDVKSRLRLAEHFEALEQWEKMSEVLTPAAAELPRKGLLALARAYRARKDHLQEIRVLETLLSQAKKDHIVHYALGEAYISLGKRDEGLTRFEDARKLNPRYLPPYEALLRENKREGHLHDSIQIVQDMVAAFGSKATFYSELCLLYAHEAFLEKAAEICKTAIGKDPGNPDNHVILGFVVRDQQGNDAAEKILKKAAQQFPKSEFAQWAAGELNWERKNYPAAVKNFEKAVTINPRSGRAQIGLARAAFEERRYDVSLKAFVQACSISRNHVPEFRKSAASLRQRGDVSWASRFDSGIGKCGLN